MQLSTYLSPHASVRLSCPQGARRLSGWKKRSVVKALEDEEGMRISGPGSAMSEESSISGETIGEKLERYRRGSLITKDLAQKTVERDFYSGNWDGDQYKGSDWNILTTILIISVVTPLVGLLFAYLSYGTVWGLGSQAI